MYQIETVTMNNTCDIITADLVFLLTVYKNEDEKNISYIEEEVYSTKLGQGGYHL